MNKHIFALMLGAAVVGTGSAFAMDRPYDGGYGSVPAKAPYTGGQPYSGGEDLPKPQINPQPKPVMIPENAPIRCLLQSIEPSGTPSTAFANFEGKKYRVGAVGKGAEIIAMLIHTHPYPQDHNLIQKLSIVQKMNAEYMETKVETIQEKSQTIKHITFIGKPYMVHNPLHVYSPQEEPEGTEVFLPEMKVSLYEVLSEKTSEETSEKAPGKKAAAKPAAKTPGKKAAAKPAAKAPGKKAAAKPAAKAPGKKADTNPAYNPDGKK